MLCSKLTTSLNIFSHCSCIWEGGSGSHGRSFCERSTPLPALPPAPVICAEMSPRVSHLLSVTPDPDCPSRDVSHTVGKTGGITQTHGATITRVTGGIREVSRGTPTLERSPLLWLERESSWAEPSWCLGKTCFYTTLSSVVQGRTPSCHLRRQHRRKNEIIILLCPDAILSKQRIYSAGWEGG